MQIHQLPEQQTVDDADMLAIDTGQTTRRTPFSAIKAIISTFAHQLTNLTETTAVSDEDVLPIDDGNGAKKITYGNLKNKITQDATPAFNSVDTSSPAAWTSVAVLASSEVLTSVYNKISAMFKNVRWLYSRLGTTSISGIGDGTVTGAIAALNTGANPVESQTITFSSTYVSSGTITIRKKGGVAMIFGGNVVVSTAIPAGTLLATIPDGYRPYHETYVLRNSSAYMFRIVSSGNLYAGAAIATGTYYFNQIWMHQ